MNGYFVLHTYVRSLFYIQNVARDSEDPIMFLLLTESKGYELKNQTIIGRKQGYCRWIHFVAYTVVTIHHQPRSKGYQDDQQANNNDYGIISAVTW